MQNIESQLTAIGGTFNFPSSFGEDAVGNLYVTDLTTNLDLQTNNTGEIYRIVTDAFVPGDFDADGDVDNLDLTVWEGGYGTPSGASATDGDADGDHDVDGRDFLLWQRNYGKNSMNYVPLLPAEVSAPEPTAWCLAMLGFTACVIARGRRTRATC